MIWYTLVGELIFWSPIWVFSLLGLITQNGWFWSVVALVTVFWAGPFTPAVPLQIALILALKKLHNKIIKKE